MQFEKKFFPLRVKCCYVSSAHRPPPDGLNQNEIHGKKVYDGKGGGNIIARFFLFQIKLISGFSFSLVSRQLFMAYIYSQERKGVGISIYAVIRIINKINTFFRAYLLALTLG